MSCNVGRTERVAEKLETEVETHHLRKAMI